MYLCESLSLYAHVCLPVLSVFLFSRSVSLSVMLVRGDCTIAPTRGPNVRSADEEAIRGEAAVVEVGQQQLLCHMADLSAQSLTVSLADQVRFDHTELWEDKRMLLLEAPDGFTDSSVPAETTVLNSSLRY